MLTRLLRKHALDITMAIGFCAAMYGIVTWYNPPPTPCPENFAVRYEVSGQPIVCVHRDDVDAFDRKMGVR